MKNWSTPLIGYHGCEREVAEKVLAGDDGLTKSQNDYDWLGDGIYFWVNSYQRAIDWANQMKFKEPYVIGAFILPRNCLDLTDFGVANELKNAYRLLDSLRNISKIEMPVNSTVKNGVPLKRSLDCAVIKVVHYLKKLAKENEYDAVYGIFEEGSEIYPGSALKEKTHIQMAVRNTNAIIGYFRPPELCNIKS